MWDMLRYVVTSGTGRAAQLSQRDAIGKTGTTSSNKDVWFMGATKQLVTGVWIGYDKPRELARLIGRTLVRSGLALLYDGGHRFLEQAQRRGKIRRRLAPDRSAPSWAPSRT